MSLNFGRIKLFLLVAILVQLASTQAPQAGLHVYEHDVVPGPSSTFATFAPCPYGAVTTTNSTVVTDMNEVLGLNSAARITPSRPRLPKIITHTAQVCAACHDTATIGQSVVALAPEDGTLAAACAFGMSALLLWCVLPIGLLRRVCRGAVVAAPSTLILHEPSLCKTRRCFQSCRAHFLLAFAIGMQAVHTAGQLNVTQLASSTACSSPVGVAVNSATGIVYAACYFGGIISINGSTITALDQARTACPNLSCGGKFSNWHRVCTVSLW